MGPVRLVGKVRDPLCICLTLSRLVNSCGGECTLWDRQQEADWFFIQVTLVERSLEPCVISGSAKSTGQESLGWYRRPLRQRRIRGWGWGAVCFFLVKGDQDHVSNRTSVDSDTWVQGCHCYLPCLNPVTDMTWCEELLNMSIHGNVVYHVSQIKHRLEI